MKYDVGNWVKSARLNADLSQEQLALALNLSGKAVISAWENNKNSVSFDVMLKISDLCGYPLPYVEPNKAKDISKPKDGYIRIKQLDISTVADNGKYIADQLEVIQQFEICESWVKKNIGNNPEKIAIIIAKGDLMRPTFNDGDLLFVDTAIHFYVSDGIYVFFTDNGLRVKRLQLLFNGDYRITSDNHIAYAPETIPHNDLEKTYICGRVVAHWAIHKL